MIENKDTTKIIENRKPQSGLCSRAFDQMPEDLIQSNQIENLKHLNTKSGIIVGGGVCTTQSVNQSVENKDTTKIIENEKSKSGKE